MAGKTTCSIEGCGHSGKITRGWCAMHYQRWRKFGDTGPAGRTTFRTPTESFSARTAWNGECLVWTSALTSEGYGELWVEDRMVKAHRYAWEQARGPIPSGMDIDHICWNRACCRVEHLRLATRVENSRSRPGPNTNSTTGVRNVYKIGRSYVVRIGIGGKTHQLGTYPTLDEAERAAIRHREILFREFAGRH